MATLADIAKDVLDYVESVNATWVGGTNAYNTPVMPARTNGVPVEALFIWVAGGIPVQRYIGDAVSGPVNERYFQPSLAIQIRHNGFDYDTGRVRANTLFLDLERAPRSASYMALQMQAAHPLYIGTDGDENHLWSLPCTVQRIATT